MFDHVGISVADLDASKAFFETALTPLGIQLLEDNRLSDGGRWRVFGTSGNAAFFCGCRWRRELADGNNVEAGVGE
jgi:catechol 2,3-dioxygenase-like lactoylglutathione lyase family enzyme